MYSRNSGGSKLNNYASNALLHVQYAEFGCHAV